MCVFWRQCSNPGHEWSLREERLSSVPHSVVSDSLRPNGLRHARLPCPSPTRRTCSNSCPLSQWCHPTISSSVIPFSSCLLSFPTSGSILMSQLFTSGGQSVGASASASVLPIIMQDWFPLELTDLIFLQSKGLSRVFSNTMKEEWDPNKAKLFWGDLFQLLEKAMAPHSTTLAWKIPWTEEPGRLQSMGSLRVGHDWATSLSLFTFMH